MRAIPLTIVLLFGSAVAAAAGVKIEINGLPEEQREAVRASLELNNYDKRDISPAELRAAYRKADEQIKSALEPFGFYDPRITPHLTGDEANGWTARFDVVPGDPAIVRVAKVEVAGEGKEQRRVAEAVSAFVPKVGQRFDHATYEASKAVVDTSLRGAGFLDAKYLTRRVTVRPEEQSADIDLTWESGIRYRFGAVRFSGDAPFPEEFLREFVSWDEGAYFNSEQVLNLQQRLVDADYFELVSVQPALDEKKDGTVPLDILLKRDERTVYSGEVYYSTDFGGGVRLGADRRWLNRKGHKAGAKVEYSERLQEAEVHYKIPLPGREDRTYNFGVGYRDETTDVNRSQNFQIAATRSEKRWHGFTRTLGLKYLVGDFEIGQDEDNLEYGNSNLLFAEGTLSRRRINDRLAPRKGYVLEFGGRLAAEALVSDTDLAQVFGRITWLIPQGERGRFKLRGEAGAMSVGNFDALPPDLRFYAGGDRSLRGFDYHDIGEVSANGNIIGGEFLAIASAEYEYYFTEDWGAGVFVDAGDAFTNGFSLNVGAGLGIRWRSPLGPIRVDVGFPVQSDLPTATSWRLHVLLGPDL
ncbi:MAG TPA: outer membrane protein assembly factor [Steroidobacteraceae bacterium]|nr:outer membrane protein assembly factor [Steroidobacteraceae bacterium]